MILTALTRALYGALALGVASIALSLSIEAQAQQPSRPVGAGPALWRFSDADSTLWIFGSVHALSPGLDWRRPELDAALEEADYVYFETRGDYFAQAQLTSLIASLGMNPPGELLSDSLSPQMAEKLREISIETGLPADELEAMRPWMAMMTIGVQLMINDGAEFEEGVDGILEVAALKAGKELRYFESGAQQLRFLADIPHDDQVRMLAAFLETFEIQKEIGASLEEAWLRGDVEKLGEDIALSFTGAPPILYERLILIRNHAWAEELDAFMDGSGDALVIVGAGHMTGEDSLIKLLEQRGHVATRR